MKYKTRLIIPITLLTFVSIIFPVDVANGSDITDYNIEYSTDGTNYTTFSDGTSTATTATVTGLTNLTVYTLRVTAVNSIGVGSSTTVSCTPTA